MKKRLGTGNKNLARQLKDFKPKADEVLQRKPPGVMIDSVIRTKGGTGEFSCVRSLVSKRTSKTLVLTENEDAKYEGLVVGKPKDINSLHTAEYKNGLEVVTANWMRNDTFNKIFDHIKDHTVSYLIVAVGMGSGAGAVERVERLKNIANKIYITYDSHDTYSNEQKEAVFERFNHECNIDFLDLAKISPRFSSLRAGDQ